MEPFLLRYRPLRWFSIAAFLCVAYGPIAGAFAGSLHEPFLSLTELLSARRMELLAQSLTFSFAIAVFTTVVGVLAALALARYLPRSARKLAWLLLATIALPTTVAAMGWSYFFAVLSSITGSSISGSWLGAAMAQGMALLPFASGVALQALCASDMRLIDAARVLVSPARLLFTIAVPLARPTLVSGAALVFLLSLLDYTIPSIFGVNTYALEIFVAFSATHRVSDALLLSVPLVGSALLLIATVSGLPKQLAQATTQTFPCDGALPLPLRAALLLGAMLCLAALLVPLAAMLPALGNPAYLGRTLVASWRETGYTLATSTTAALLALPLAIGPAVQILLGGPGARLVWALCLLPFLAPPALIGVGLIALWAPVHFVDIYGSHWMTIAAELARFTPVSIVVLAAWLLRTDPTLFESAIIGATSLRKMAVQVLLPLTIPGLLGAAGIAFVLSIGEIGANLLVAPAGSATLSLKTYNYLHYGGSQAAAGLCLLLLAMAVLGVAVPAWIINRLTRIA